MKLNVFILIFVTVFDSNASGGIKKLSLNEMMELSDSIALVKVLEYEELKNDNGSVNSKNLMIEVLDPILNLKKGDTIVLLEYSGLDGSELDFTNIGGEAIVLMSELDYKTNGFRTFYSVGFKSSVFRKTSNGFIEGLGFWSADTSYDKAVAKLKRKIKQIKN